MSAGGKGWGSTWRIATRKKTGKKSKNISKSHTQFLSLPGELRNGLPCWARRWLTCLSNSRFPSNTVSSFAVPSSKEEDTCILRITEIKNTI